MHKTEWKEIIYFCLLSYFLAWAYWIPFLAGGVEGIKSFPGPYGFANGMFAPMASALVMRIFVSREGIKGSLGVVRPIKYYLAALLAPVLYTAVLVFIIIITFQSDFIWPGKKPIYLAVLLLILKSFREIPLGIGEEYGWRGYLLPRLMPAGEAGASILIGLIWAFWHLPMMVLGMNYPGQNVIISSLIFVIFVILMSFPFTWLYLASRGSVLVVALFHIALDVFTDTFCSPACLPDGNQLFVSSAGITSCLMLFVIIFIRYTVFKDVIPGKKT